MFPQLARFEDIAILLLRLMVGAIFASSGWSHLKDPEGRSKSIGMSKGFTVFLGAAELAGAHGRDVRRADAACRCWINFADARRNPKEDFRVEDRLLGQARNRWLALRPDAGRDEPGHHSDEWRKVRIVDVTQGAQTHHRFELFKLDQAHNVSAIRIHGMDPHVVESVLQFRILGDHGIGQVACIGLRAVEV